MKHVDSLIIVAVAFVLSLGCEELLCRWAIDRTHLALPNERSSHTRPTPYGGGLAIVGVILVGFIAYSIWQHNWSWFQVGGYAIGGLLIAGISWLDDVRTVSYRWRLGVHSISAFLVIIILGCCRESNMPLGENLHLSWLGPIIIFFWIVGLTNAYNFMDGIDGIAGGQAVVTGCSWAALGNIGGYPMLEVLGWLVAGGSLGFLVYNWSPARIFMGDVGSAFLGYTFAVLPFMVVEHNLQLAVAGFLMVWPFIFDSIFTFVRRLCRGENVFAAHRSHLYQRLVSAGYSHQSVSLLYIGLAVIGTMLAFTWWMNVRGSDVGIVVALPCLCVALWSFVVLRERKHAGKSLS